MSQARNYLRSLIIENTNLALGQCCELYLFYQHLIQNNSVESVIKCFQNHFCGTILVSFKS